MSPEQARILALLPPEEPRLLAEVSRAAFGDVAPKHRNLTRQHLLRLVKAGAVTRPQRGVYRRA